jgi:hypothetical protein
MPDSERSAAVLGLPKLEHLVFADTRPPIKSMRQPT